MTSLTTRLGAATIAALATLALAAPLLAQPTRTTVGMSQFQQQQLSTNLAVNQWATQAVLNRYNTALLAGSGYYNPYYNFNYGLGGSSAASYIPPVSPYGGVPGVAPGSMTSISPYSTSTGGPGFTSVPSLPTQSPYPYGPYAYQDPLAGYLQGAAQIYNAQGQFQIQRAQARMMTEQWKQAQQDTRRRIHEEWLWERANTPTLQDIREQEQKEKERYAMRTPDITDVWNGTTLNTLLNKAQQSPNASAGPNIGLSEDVVKHINLAPGKSNYSLASVKQLKDGVALNWPLVFRSDIYQSELTLLNQLLPKVVQAAYTDGKVEPNSLLEIRANLDKLYDKLDNNTADLGPSQYIPAKRFLNQLDEALKALQQDNVDKYFNKLGNVKSVADLVREMTAKGLTFGPAGNGDEAAYLAVQQALAGYNSGLLNAAPK